MKNKHLSNKEIKQLNQQLKEFYNLDNFLNKKDKTELIEDEFKLITVNNEVYFFYHEEKLIPTLKLIIKNTFLPKIIIDMPAVKFIANGADVMRPGIKGIDTFEKDQIIVIVDETHQKSLAIGQALFNSKEIKDLETGKVIKNLHYVGDKVWNY
ncbi:MAG: DUF1947 domain-containing protein [Nanoarchaeota archaeon]|nr:DUF1947 domain-containing protein [Nanoarchaeota archaeon]